MQKPWAFLNGRMIPADELVVPAYDAGFVLGATVSEQLRTFGGKLFEMEAHWSRLRRSLEIVGIEPHITLDELATLAEELVAANHKLLDPADDLGLSLFITPGPYATLAPPNVPRRPTIGMSTYPLPFHLWAEKYERGEILATSTVRQVPPESWPAELKCRSRMHYYLADQDVRQAVPGARALLLDRNGHVNETSTANVMGVMSSESGPSLWTPQSVVTLPGISQAAVRELGRRELGILGDSEGDFSPDEFVRGMSEVFLTSTPFCMLPVVKLDDHTIGDGKPGPMFKKLLQAWSEEVGVDIAEQARRFANR
ncbi:MAG: aminotransferase class IV [Planctomycetes bacterium]|nr:aminotransferase class IV [Planctomycetota bacterium]